MTYLIGAAIIAAIILIIVHRGLQMKNLAHHGIVALGRITKKSRRRTPQKGNSSAYLKYEFFTRAGIRFERSIAVGEEIYDSFDENDTIDVVYLRGKPEVNGAKYMVNLSREALRLPPL
jgi:hypothetical protein